jgi:hypothetical protein
MKKEIKNTFSIISKLFDTDFQSGCDFEWPFSLAIAEYVFDHGCYCENLEQIIAMWEILARQDIDEQISWFIEGDPINDEETLFNRDTTFFEEEFENLQNVLNQIRQSKISTWPYGKILCSAISCVFHQKLYLTGKLDSNLWYQLIIILISVNSKIRDEIFNFIEKNGYFYLNPQLAIDGTVEYLSIYKGTTCFFDGEDIKEKKEQKEKMICLLKLLQIKDSQAELLISNACKNRSFSPIIKFLKDSSFVQPEFITLKQLEAWLNQIDLNQAEKTQIIIETSTELESIKPTDLLSTWDNLTVSSNVEVFELYAELPEREKFKLLNKDIYSIITQLINTVSVFEEQKRPYKIILYPPVNIIQSRLNSLSVEDWRTLSKFFLKNEKIKDKGKLEFLMRKIGSPIFYVLFSMVIAVAPADAAVRGRVQLPIAPNQTLGTRVTEVGSKTRFRAQARIVSALQTEDLSIASPVDRVVLPSTARVKSQKVLVATRAGAGKLIFREENLPKKSQYDISKIQEEGNYKVILDGVEFHATIRVHIDKNTNQPTKLLTIFGTEGRYKQVTNATKKLVASLGSDIIYNRKYCQLDHLGTIHYLKSMSIPKERAGVIAVLTPHNFPRTAGSASLNDLGRPANISYRSAIQDNLNPVEGFTPGLINSFNRVVKNPTNIPYSEEAIEVILRQLPLAIDRYRTDVDELFIKAYDIPEGCGFLIMEASGSAISMEEGATTLRNLMRDDLKNLPPQFFSK